MYHLPAISEHFRENHKSIPDILFPIGPPEIIIELAEELNCQLDFRDIMSKLIERGEVDYALDIVAKIGHTSETFSVLNILEDKITN